LVALSRMDLSANPWEPLKPCNLETRTVNVVSLYQQIKHLIGSFVVKDLRLKDKDEDLKIGPRGQGPSSRTTTLL